MASAIGESSYSCMCVSILSIDRQPPSIHSILPFHLFLCL
jgi:hypothetical protein